MRRFVRWSDLASIEFVEAMEFIAADSQNAANDLADRIRSRVEALAENSGIGRLGRYPGTREFVLTGTPFVAIYRIVGDEIVVARLLHGRQLWPPA